MSCGVLTGPLGKKIKSEEDLTVMGHRCLMTTHSQHGTREPSVLSLQFFCEPEIIQN